MTVGQAGAVGTTGAVVEEDASRRVFPYDGVELSDRSLGLTGGAGEHLEDRTALGLIEGGIQEVKVEDRGASDRDIATHAELVMTGRHAGAGETVDFDLERAGADAVSAEVQDARRVAGGDDASGLLDLADDGAASAEVGASCEEEVLRLEQRTFADGSVDDDVGRSIRIVVTRMGGTGFDDELGVVEGLDVADDRTTGAERDEGVIISQDVAGDHAAGGDLDGGGAVEVDVSVQSARNRDGRRVAIGVILGLDVGVDDAARLDGDDRGVVGVDGVRGGQRAGDDDGRGVIEVDFRCVEVDDTA